MKISMLMLVAGAAIAVVAPVASAHEVYTEHSYIPHKIVKHVKTTGAKSSVATKATPRPPIYIYVPPFTGTPAVADGTDWCQTNMVDCTDQQLCETWGLNCSTGGAQSAPAQPASGSASTTSGALALTSQLAAATVDGAQSASQMSSAVSSNQDSFDDC